MKTQFSILFAILGIAFGNAQQDDRPEYTGDNFSLEGALAVFKNAKSLEDFEKSINEENSNVNNLDLNNDGEIDYITVNALKENDTHVIILSTYLNATEKQDIATIGIEKTGKEEAQLQIEGDINLYPQNTIIEPFEVEEKAGNNRGPNTFDITPIRVIVNVWLWPSVRFLYAPGYVVWVSPYRWGNYPHWWKPWRPFRHTVFYSRCASHRVYFHKTTVHRVSIARKVYAPKRTTSTLVVKNKRNTTIVRKTNRGTKVVKTNRTTSKGRR